MPRRKSEEEKELTGSIHVMPTVEASEIEKSASGLCPIGQAEWQRVVDAYDRLCELDHSLLLLYCSSFARWKKAEQAVSEQGELLWIEVRDTHGKVTHKKPIQNPMLRVAEQAARAMHKYGESLGLSPASRVKQGYNFKPRPKKQLSAWEQMQQKAKP